MILEHHPLLDGAIRSIDGLNVALATLDDPELENATYNGWLHGHFAGCVLVFSPQGRIAYQCSSGYIISLFTRYGKVVHTQCSR